MKLKSVWGRVKSFAGTMRGKQILVASGLVVIAVIAIVGIQVYIHCHNPVAVTAANNNASSGSVSEVSSGPSSAPDTSSSTTTSSTPASSAASSVQSVAVQSVTLNQTSISLKVGQTAQLSANVNPGNATDKAITWSSSDKYTAGVNSSGIVTAGQAGTAYVYAKASNGVSAQCKVSVTSSSTGNDNGDGKSSGTGGTTGGGSTGGGGGSTGGGGGSTGGGGSSTTPTGQNLANLATYGDFPYPYGVSETNPQFQVNEPNFDTTRIYNDIVNWYTNNGYTFVSNKNNVFRDGHSDGEVLLIRGELSGHGETHVVDVAVGTDSTGYIPMNIRDKLN